MIIIITHAIVSIIVTVVPSWGATLSRRRRVRAEVLEDALKDCTLAQVHVYMCLYVCIHVCVYVCIYIYIYTHICWLWQDVRDMSPAWDFPNGISFWHEIHWTIIFVLFLGALYLSSNYIWKGNPLRAISSKTHTAKLFSERPTKRKT